MTETKRAIASVLFLYALTVALSSLSVGMNAYLENLWGYVVIWGFVIWFSASGFYLLAWPYSFRGLYLSIAPQVAYFAFAVAYVLFDGLLRGRGAVWGAIAIHGSVLILLWLTIWLVRKIELRGLDGATTATH